MTLLGLDVGSSSVIAGVLRGTAVVKQSVRAFYASRHDGPKVDVDGDEILRAIREAVASLGDDAKRVDAVALAVMAPAWVAMDAKGKALTPLVTHQDRRSVEVALDLERRVGKERHLAIAGCRPFPGGISSTTWAWYLRNEPARLKRADLVGHLNTFLHRKLTGARVTDPSNASFMGVYRTTDLGGWSDELCEAVGANRALLPDVLEADKIAGQVLPSAAEAFGLTAGTPVMTGLVDGSAGVLLAGASVGQLFNVCGSTDVLALCTNRPTPHEKLLTRALGIGRKWLAVGTLAAVGSAIYWAKANLFADMPLDVFRKELFRLSKIGAKAAGGVRFEPYMAGERTSVEQRTGAFTGLTLASTREQMLSAIIEALTTASADRLPLLAATGTKMKSQVVVSGGAADRLDKLLHRDWPGKWTYKAVTEATLAGLGTMVPRK
ncbi:MAG: Carbohydrate kinase [Phycisphaerales bacterium]|nr:Carbohydrate kinase [Phycisphaerales bacterium]